MRVILGYEAALRNRQAGAFRNTLDRCRLVMTTAGATTYLCNLNYSLLHSNHNLSLNRNDSFERLERGGALFFFFLRRLRIYHILNWL
jgi:hypothetical protein